MKHRRMRELTGGMQDQFPFRRVVSIDCAQVHFRDPSMSQKHCQRYSSALFETYRVWGIFQCLRAVPSNPPLDTPCEMSDPANNVLREIANFRRALRI